MVDDTAPVFATVLDQTVFPPLPGVGPAAYPMPSVSDDSGVVDVVCVPASGSVLPLGDTEVTCTATDDSGNSSEVSFTVTVVDVAAPVFGAVLDQTVFPPLPGVSPTVFVEPSATDNSGVVSVVCDPASGDVLGLGDHRVFCVAEDGSGNSRSVWFVVTVADETDPVFAAAEDQTFFPDRPGVDGVEFEVPSVSDNSGVAPSVVCDPVSGSVFPIGATLVTCTATDGSGNSSSVSFTVTVLDVAVPVFDTPVDQTMFPDRPGVDRVEFVVPSATDNSGVVDVVCVPESGSLFPIGATEVTCTATDGSGNSSEVSFTVTVADVTAPVFGTVEDQTLYPEVPGSDPVPFVEPSATDDSGVVVVVCVPASGSVLPLGDHPVSCTATDGSGSSRSASFTVTVADKTAPVFNSVDDLTVYPARPGRDGVEFVEPSATDNAGPVDVACAPASGDVFELGGTTVSCTATDGSQNTAQTSFTVTVVDELPPVFGTATDQTFTPAAPGVEGIDFMLPVVSDNSGVATVLCDPASGSVLAVGDTEVSCTAMDESGHRARASFMVTVVDVVPPVWESLAPMFQTVSVLRPGEDRVWYELPSAIDGHDGAAVVCVPMPGSVLPVGETVVSCTATDSSGNVQSMSMSITVAELATELPATGSGGLPLWPAWMLVLLGWALWSVGRSRRRA
ncbi:MAG: HYR domain-containing protein [Ilumatobacteraceae bacterium]